ncbi:MAG: hypothetical protein ACREU9_05555 [Gammaproteobacteria bacterium]
MLPALLLGGCSWVELAWHALSYPSTRSGESANVVVHGEWAYVTKGAAGIEVVHLGRREPTRVVPVQGGESADDLAVADGLLFALDAQPPGHLSVYTLEDHPRLLCAIPRYQSRSVRSPASPPRAAGSSSPVGLGAWRCAVTIGLASSEARPSPRTSAADSRM